MVTSQIFSKNLKNNIITTSMLEAALFSVNKRAKNYRDKERTYRHGHGLYDYKNAENMRLKKEEMYKKKETLLSIMQPICIHKEFMGYEKTRVYDYEEQYDEEYFYHFLHGTIVWENSYMDWELDEEVFFFDYILLDQPKYNFYLYYAVGNHTFHNPIKDPTKYDLPIKEIGRLETFGEDIKDLASMQFVDKILNLIAENNFTYTQDLQSTLPQYPEHYETDSFVCKPEWFEIWNYISCTLNAEAKKMTGNIRSLTNEEKEKIHIRQKCKKPNKKMQKQGITEMVWKKPILKFPDLKIECPEMDPELRNYIEENYVDEMGERDFALMILSSPYSFHIQEEVDAYYSMKAYCEQLQKKANELFEKTNHQVSMADLPL